VSLVECENCGTEVEKIPSLIKRAEHHFCSKECHNEWKSENVRGEKHPLFTKKKISCDYCGKEFLRKPSHINRRNYCSPECKKKGLTERKKIKVVCTTCGREFKKYEDRVKNHDNHFCSRECFENRPIKGKNNPNWKGGFATDITHRREFDTAEEANALNNLITLCKSCHGKANMGEIPKEELRGLIL